MKENKQLEFKEKVSATFLKTVSAFANYGGGQILFGVKDNGERIGLSEPVDACLRIEQAINDTVSPQINYNLEIDSDQVVSLQVYAGASKPYLYKGKAYKRNDSSSLVVDQFELRRLVMEGENLYFERLTASEQKLTFKTLEHVLKDIIGISRLDTNVLKTLDLLNHDGNYVNAAALLADSNSFFGIDIACFGDDISHIKERITLSNCSVLMQLDEAMMVFRRYYQYEVIKGVERKLVEKIPEEAFRETIANALIHREWDVPAHIKISMYPNRIVISSPGSLPVGLTEEEFLSGHISKLRNPILGNVFFRLHYIEMFGTGVLRIMHAYESNILKPHFELTENAIVTHLPVLTTKVLMSDDEKFIYQLIKDYGQLSSAELVSLTDFTKSKCLRLLKKLQDKDYVRVQGKGKGTRYTT